MPRKLDTSTPGGRIASRRNEIDRYRRSQAGLASDVGVARGTVSAWENDEYVPEGENLRRLSEVLGVSMEYILTGVDQGHSVVRESGDVDYDPNPDPEGSPAEQLMAFLGQRVGMRRVAGSLTSKDLIAVAYTIAREERFESDEFKKIDRWRDEIMAMERSAPD